MPQIISATQARNQFAEIVDRVAYAGEKFVVQKQGKPVAVISAVDKPQKRKNRKMTGTEFLLKLAAIKAKGLPADLAKNHDKYAWD